MLRSHHRALLLAAALLSLVLPSGASAQVEMAKALCADPTVLSLFTIMPIDGGGCTTYDWQVSPAYSGPYYSDTASADAAEPPPPASVSPALPTWSNVYDWPNGHGYVGWHTAQSSQVGAYGMQGGLGGQYGLWLWPVGGSSYSYSQGQYAEYTYTAPGTTRLANSVVSFTYRNKLLAHHCIDIGFRDAAGAVIAHNEHCTPVSPPDSQRGVTVTLVDPLANPTSKVLYVRIRVDCGGATTCSKNIPQLDPLSTGGYVRVTKADMTLVDDDEPQVMPEGSLVDDTNFTNGVGSYPVTINVHDDGAGISGGHIVTLNNGADFLSGTAPCDPAHHTEELDARICPADWSFAASVDASTLPEGQNDFDADSQDPAANAGTSDSWRAYVDKTPPAPASDFAVDSFDPATGTARVAWGQGEDPATADANPGSGAESETVRYRVNGGAWSAWTTSDDSSLAVANAHVGDTIDVEVQTADGVGNTSAAAAATVTVGADTPPPDAEGSDTAVWPSASASVLQQFRVERRAAFTGPVDMQPNATGDGWVFHNDDGDWTIYRSCVDRMTSGGRQGWGPGYIAHAVDKYNRTLVDDDRVRTSVENITPYNPNDAPNSTVGHGYLGAYGVGGLGTFGSHYARGLPSHIPAGRDPLGAMSSYELNHTHDNVTGKTQNLDARTFPLLDGRMCSTAYGGNWGVYSVTLPQHPFWKKKGNPYVDPSHRFATLAVNVWLRDGTGNTTKGPNGDALILVTYKYLFLPTVVKSWMLVTTFAKTASDGSKPFIKEPKFAVSIRGGNFKRLSLFGGAAGTYWINAQTAAAQGSPFANGVLPTKQEPTSDRTRVRWDYGSAGSPDRDKRGRLLHPGVDPSPSSSVCTEPGTTRTVACFNAVMRAYRVAAGSDIVPGLPAPFWKHSNTVDRAGPWGLDWWARRSQLEHRDKAYANDTEADSTLVPPEAWPCRYTKAWASAAKGAARSKQGALDSVGTNTGTGGRRAWELEGYKNDSGVFYASTLLAHGWEGGRGPYDCEQMQVAYGAQGERYGTFASYSVGDGWTLDNRKAQYQLPKP